MVFIILYYVILISISYVYLLLLASSSLGLKSAMECETLTSFSLGLVDCSSQDICRGRIVVERSDVSSAAPSGRLETKTKLMKQRTE